MAEIELVVTELLPDIGEAWLPDAQGGTYFSELRLHIRDPQRAWDGHTGDLPVPTTRGDQ